MNERIQGSRIAQTVFSDLHTDGMRGCNRTDRTQRPRDHDLTLRQGNHAARRIININFKCIGAFLRQRQSKHGTIFQFQSTRRPARICRAELEGIPRRICLRLDHETGLFFCSTRFILEIKPQRFCGHDLIRCFSFMFYTCPVDALRKNRCSFCDSCHRIDHIQPQDLHSQFSGNVVSEAFVITRASDEYNAFKIRNRDSRLLDRLSGTFNSF